MKTIHINELLEVDSDGVHTYSGKGRPSEGSKISVVVSHLSCSCNLAPLESHYTSSNGEVHIYGEATSIIDRAFEKAFCLMVSEEVANVHINFSKNVLEDRPDDLYIKCEVRLTILEMHKPVYACSDDEKLHFASKYKNLGVALYKERTLAKQLSACLFFSQAVKWLSMIDLKSTEEQRSKIEELKANCYNNLGLYYINKRNYLLALEATTKVLKVDKGNVKALFRRAIANTELQNYEKAEDDLKAALLLDPGSGPVKKQMEVVKSRQKALSDKYALAMKKFLS